MGFGIRKSRKLSARLPRSNKPIKKRPSGQIDGFTTGSRPAQDFRDLSLRILHHANRAIPVADFLRAASKMILDFSGCDSVELRLKEGDSYFHCEAKRRVKQSFLYEFIPPAQKDEGVSSSGSQKDSALERLCDDILNRRFDSPLPFLTKKGSFWTGNTRIPLNFDPKAYDREGSRSVSIGGHYRSLALIPLFVGNESIGLLQLKSRRRDYFPENEIELYEDLAQNLGIAVVNQRVHAASNERVKELTCLYGIAKAAERAEISLEEILQRIVGLLPQAWQYPENAFGRIILDGVSYSTPGFQDSRQKQSATITVNGKNRGFVEVVYAEKKPKLDEGPFLKEERSLIDAVTRQVALLIERREAEEDKSNLQNQLRHADRLATIGQLAAGVAHELNEPLGNILGFAQLAKKCQGLPNQAEEDIEQIVTASLDAREVIKKLLLTARQMPPRKTHINLNQVVKDGLYLFEPRCAKEGIEVVRSL